MLHTTTGWVMPWSAEETLDGHHQRVEIPANARTAQKGLLQKKNGRGSLLIIPHIPLMTQSVKGLNWTEPLLTALGASFSNWGPQTLLFFLPQVLELHSPTHPPCRINPGPHKNSKCWDDSHSTGKLEKMSNCKLRPSNTHPVFPMEILSEGHNDSLSKLLRVKQVKLGVTIFD